MALDQRENPVDGGHGAGRDHGYGHAPLGLLAGERHLFRIDALARDVEEHLFHVASPVALQQRGRRSLVHDHARAQHDHGVAHPLHLPHVVRREQHGAATATLVALEQRAHAIAGVGVERRSRFVEQQHFGTIEQCLGEADARALSRRQVAERPVEQVGEIEFFGQFVERGRAAAARRRGARRRAGSR